MKTSKLLKTFAASVLIVFAAACKQSNEGQDVGTNVGNGDMYNDPGSGNTEDHSGQNIGSDNDSTTVDGPKGSPSNN